MSQQQPLFVTSLADLAPPPDASGSVTEALVHRTPHAQVVVQMVPPGGQLEPHHHTGLWDYFVGLSGEATVSLAGDDDSTYDVDPGGFLAVPPGTTHRICNHSAEVPFVFLLVQTPYSAFDFVRD